MPQLGVALQRHALHLQQLLRRHPRLDGITRGQTLAHRQHHGIRQGGLIRCLSTALLLLVTDPQAPFGSPLAIIFPGMHGQQGISPVTLGSVLQWGRVAALKVFRRSHQLLTQVCQRQAQRQATMLRGAAQRLGHGLTVTDQARTLDRVVQPPAEQCRTVAAPQRQAGLA